MDYLNTAFTFPTLIFSVLMLIVLCFWLITIFGFADIDMFEADLELEAQGQQGDSDVSGSIVKFGFGDLPITVSISLVVMLSWLVSIYAHQTFAYLLGDGVTFYVMGAVMVLTSIVVAVPLAMLLGKPLGRFFESKETASKVDVLGMECVIATSKVTHSFGQARITFQGAEQLIEVRVQGEEEFKRGDTGVLIEHDNITHSYVITTKPW